MRRTHSIYDSDAHFKIDPITRGIKNEESTKTNLVQNDHNSERFTFELPRFVEGHDMLNCNKIQVHYLNIDLETKEQSEGVYMVDDLQISPNSEEVVICSWLISQNATYYHGSLNFALRFACVDDKTAAVAYVWNTAIYTAVSVSQGICNDEIVMEIPLDILTAWHAKVLEDALGAVTSAEEAATRAEKAAEIIDETVRDALQEAKDSGDFDGVTFTPELSPEGELSWSNDGGLDNPEPVKLKGDPFTYEDFTPEQIDAIKKDAVEGVLQAIAKAHKGVYHGTWFLPEPIKDMSMLKIGTDYELAFSCYINDTGETKHYSSIYRGKVSDENSLLRYKSASGNINAIVYRTKTGIFEANSYQTITITSEPPDEVKQFLDANGVCLGSISSEAFRLETQYKELETALSETTAQLEEALEINRDLVNRLIDVEKAVELQNLIGQDFGTGIIPMDVLDMLAQNDLTDGWADQAIIFCTKVVCPAESSFSKDLYDAFSFHYSSSVSEDTGRYVYLYEIRLYRYDPDYVFDPDATPGTGLNEIESLLYARGEQHESGGGTTSRQLKIRFVEEPTGENEKLAKDIILNPGNY